MEPGVLGFGDEGQAEAVSERCSLVLRPEQIDRLSAGETHVSALSFEQILRLAPARYVLGLTATPIRWDGLHPIMFMRCGPMRVTVKRQKGESSTQQVVIWKEVPNSGSVTTEMAMTDLYAASTADSRRTDLIVADIVEALA